MVRAEDVFLENLRSAAGLASADSKTYLGKVLVDGADKSFTLRAYDLQDCPVIQGTCVTDPDVATDFPNGQNFDTDMLAVGTVQSSRAFGSTGGGDGVAGAWAYEVLTFAAEITGRDRASFNSDYRAAWLEVRPYVSAIEFISADAGMTICLAPILGVNGSAITYGAVRTDNAVSVIAGLRIGRGGDL